MSQKEIDLEKKANAAEKIKEKGSVWRITVNEVTDNEKPWAPEEDMMPDYFTFNAIRSSVSNAGLYFSQDNVPSELFQLTTANLEVEISLSHTIEKDELVYNIKKVDVVKPGEVEILKKLVVYR